MYLAYDHLPDPTGRFVLYDVIGEGCRGKIYKATDSMENDRTVAIKIQKYDEEHRTNIEEEYRTLRDCSEHPNLLSFYGVFRKKFNSQADEIWFILEYCEYGSMIDIVKALHSQKRSLEERHVAFIMREVTRALVHLHDHHTMHRDVRGANILLNKSGDIKLADYGLSRDFGKTNNKRFTSIGSPHWMSPEMVKGDPNKRKVNAEDDDGGYDNRCDVWGIGITALEIAEGRVPFEHLHPARVLFQIVKNPPPTLFKVSNWTQDFNDFTIELLEKNYENRSFAAEVLEHPFFASIPENSHHISEEIKAIADDMTPFRTAPKSRDVKDVFYWQGYLHSLDSEAEKMYTEDIAGLDRITEEEILDQLRNRLERGSSYTFVGDVLLFVNPNGVKPEIHRDVHDKYVGKSRTENPPHAFAVADSAYADMMHHKEDQHIVMGGESYSGKSTNVWFLIKHLNIIGAGIPFVGLRIEHGLSIISAFTHAGTPVNPNSTRCVLQTELTFNATGKSSGAHFYVTNLEKLRVSTTNMNQSNFHVFYYFYDGMNAAGRLKEYNLDKGRDHRYLRIPDSRKEHKKLQYCIDDYKGNVDKFNALTDYMKFLDFSESDVDDISKILAAVLLMGDIRFAGSDKNPMHAVLDNPRTVERVAKLLQVESKKFAWALVNYCLVKDGQAILCHHTPDAARDARDTLAATTYNRLVDYIVNRINQKLAVGRALYGDLYSVIITDLFGFECFYRNGFEQLIANTVNEQLQFLYNQRMFVWEMIEQAEEEVSEMIKYKFYDNKTTVDHLMNKPNGLFCIIDDMSKRRKLHTGITETLGQNRSNYVKRISDDEFSVSHYSGKILYDARDFIEKNQDFVPPEMIETLRRSADDLPKLMFKNRLTKSGHLTMPLHEPEKKTDKSKEPSKKSKWGSMLAAEKEKTARNPQKMNTISRGEYSQITKARSLAALFRSNSLEILRTLSSNHAGIFFIRCIRGDLDYRPRGFHPDMVRQQLRAMAIMDTAKARQQGYPHRVLFADFIKRYQFLAFDFDEVVELTKENCRLMLLRLKMEGWMIGNTKVFLRYYNVEYLSRLYEMQVKKIVRVQAMMRGFLAKKHKMKPISAAQSANDKAATTIQTAYRGYKTRKEYGPLLNATTGKIDVQTAVFVNPYAQRWKSKTIFQVLLCYRAARFQDLVNFSHQIHFFNQHMYEVCTKYNADMPIQKINGKEVYASQLGYPKPSVLKMPFKFRDIPFFDTTAMCSALRLSQSKPITITGEEIDEAWDAPFHRKNMIEFDYGGGRRSRGYGQMHDDDVIVNHMYSRDPNYSMSVAPRRPTMEYSRSPANNFSPPNDQLYPPRAQSAYSRQSVDFNEQFYDDEQPMEKRPTVYKKRTAPPTPPSMSPVKVPGTPSWRKKSIAPPPPPSASARMNPIRELEQRGRQAMEEAEGENAPFNFQGMLRKTSYNRSSMKRSASENAYASNNFANNLRSRDDQQSNMVYSSSNQSVQSKRTELAPGIVIDSTFEADL